MKNPDNDQLWRDSLNGGAGETFAAGSLTRMLIYSRRRRLRRRLLGVSALVGTPVLLLCLVLSRSHPPLRPLATNQPPSIPTGDLPDAGPAQVHFLTDEELLSRFPDRPIALIGPPGERQLVFLDKVP